MLRSLTVGIVIVLSLITLLITTNSSDSTSASSQPTSIEVSQLVFSGMPNPSVSITDPGVIEELVFMLDGIPRTSPPSWAGYPFGGFLLINWAEDGRLPPMARVFDGTIEIPGVVDFEGNPVYYEDVFGLEDFLRGFFSNPAVSAMSSIPVKTGELPFSLLASTVTSEQGELPLSGSEPPYEPWKWNVKDRLRAIDDVLRKAIARVGGLELGGIPAWRAFWEAVKEALRDAALRDAQRAQFSNNCYNYACNKRTDTFAQPGRAGGKGNPTVADLTCDKMKERAKADGLTEVACNKACPAGSYKKMLFVDDFDDPNQPGDDRDYHWYRQDNTGNWSHKPGSGPATDRDDSNKPITDPRKADTDTRRDWDNDGKPDAGFEYKFCACFCCGPEVKKQ